VAGVPRRVGGDGARGRRDGWGRTLRGAWLVLRGNQTLANLYAHTHGVDLAAVEPAAVHR
jgi:hypothetical protein